METSSDGIVQSLTPAMSKTMTVVGATGTQGGGVIQALLEEGSWKIRGITRNPSSDSARALISQGVEVITVNLTDADSLAQAFKVSTSAILPPVPFN